MKRLSVIIGDLYNKHLKAAEQKGVQLDLDFADTTLEVEQSDDFHQTADKHLKSAISRAKTHDHIKLTIKSGYLEIHDSGTILSKTLCNTLSHGPVKVSSRVGFGTTVRIDFKSQNDSQNDQRS